MAFYAGQKLRPSNLGALGSTARYQANDSQDIANNTETTVSFPVALKTSSYVTRSTSGAGHVFRLNAAGLWYIGANIKWLAGADGIREGWIDTPSGRLHGEGMPGSTGYDAQLCFSTLRWFDEDTDVYIRCYQNSGGTRTLTYNPVFGWTVVEFAYVLGEG